MTKESNIKKVAPGIYQWIKEGQVLATTATFAPDGIRKIEYDDMKGKLVFKEEVGK